MKFKSLIAVICLISIPVAAIAGSDSPEDAIQARQEIMKFIGSNMRSLGAIQKGQAEFEPAMTKSVGHAIHAMSLSLPFLFVEGSFDGDTDSKQEIMTSDGFGVHLNNLQNASLMLKNATNKDDFAVAFSQLGQTCSACHREFRK